VGWQGGHALELVTTVFTPPARAFGLSLRNRAKPLVIGHGGFNDVGVEFDSTLIHDVCDSLRVGQRSFVHATRDQGIVDIRFRS